MAQGRCGHGGVASQWTTARSVGSVAGLTPQLQVHYFWKLYCLLTKQKLVQCGLSSSALTGEKALHGFSAQCLPNSLRNPSLMPPGHDSLAGFAHTLGMYLWKVNGESVQDRSSYLVSMWASGHSSSELVTEVGTAAPEKPLLIGSVKYLPCAKFWCKLSTDIYSFSPCYNPVNGHALFYRWANAGTEAKQFGHSPTLKKWVSRSEFELSRAHDLKPFWCLSESVTYFLSLTVPLS